MVVLRLLPETDQMAEPHHRSIREPVVLLDQAAVDSAREYETAVDNLGDKWEVIKIKVGQDVVPVLTQVADQGVAAP